jgi:anti-sigma factor RsiW
MSDCTAARAELLDAIRGRLAEPALSRFKAHLSTCAECNDIYERERAIEQALAERPQFQLPEGLRNKLTAQLTPKQLTRSQPKRRLGRLAAVVLPSLAAALCAGLLLLAHFAPDQRLMEEAVNDHLRVLYAEHPIEIASGGIHQVKPWFAGRLDFAPVLSFSGDDEFPLEGGAIGLFVDRKAATFLFKHRLHSASLFVFRSEGLHWPLRADASAGALPASSAGLRGFNVLLWREGDLGYALVSDMDRSALERLAAKVAQP